MGNKATLNQSKWIIKIALHAKKYNYLQMRKGLVKMTLRKKTVVQKRKGPSLMKFKIIPIKIWNHRLLMNLSKESIINKRKRL